MGACDEGAGQWWWFPLALGSGVLSLLLVGVTIGLWSGVLPSSRPVAEEPSKPGWKGVLRDHGAAALGLVVWAWLLLSAARRGDWPFVGAGAAMAAAVVVVVPAVAKALQPAVTLGELRFAAMADARPLTPAERSRVGRARWSTAVALSFSVLVCVASFGLSIGTMVEVGCPE
ncbi:hypothetical protein ACOCJ5_00655 [Knoellia sp. CPCC 206450]|uniref:hypothetical protein n=1 Tax=Knoellia tibetensis TaxID=3404798 RepID=UPI003B436D88